MQGHRGARGLFPENTQEGFAASLAIGIHTIELDVGLTRDGIAVVTHDPALNADITRTPDGAWLAGSSPLIRSLTRQELASYDVGRIRPGTAYAARFPDQRPHDGARIPDLVAVLGLDPAIGFDIEIKSFPPHPDWTAPPEEMAVRVAAALDQTATVARAVVQSFDWRVLRFLRRTRPDVSLSWLTRRSMGPETRRWWDGPDPSDFAGSYPRAVAAEGGRIWAPDSVDLTAEAVREAHALGLRVVVWTVNEPAALRRMLRLGVDGLISDRPDLAREALRAEGLPLPDKPS